MTQPTLQVELPPDVTSAAVARRHVRAFCDDSGHGAVLDDALLMVTELVTNAVVHAGTALALELSSVDGGLRVQVTDARPGPMLSAAGPVDEDREGGRGLFLLDTLATAWGSSHSRAGKALWFFLGPAPEAIAGPVRQVPAAVHLLSLADLSWLLSIADRTAELGAPNVVEELMHRLTEGLPATSAVLLGPVGQDGWQVQRHVGEVPAHLSAEHLRRLLATAGRSHVVQGDLVLSLGLGGTPTGALVLGGAGDLDVDRAALARLAADEIGVLVQEEQSQDLHRRDRGSLTLLAEASEMFAGALDVGLAAMLLCQLVVPRFGSWAAVFAGSELRTRLLASTHEDEQQGSALQVLLSASAVRDLATALPSTGAGAQLVDPSALPGGLGPFGADVLAVPLVARRRNLGLLLLGRGERGGPGGDDISLLNDLSRRAALAIEGARLFEERSEVARALQASLLPPALPEVEGLQFGARYAAAGEGNEVGGDFYDVFPGPDGTWAVAIGDVCGKGPEAATITGLARHVLRLMIEEGRTAEQALSRLNRAILDLGDRGRFLTAALVLLHPHDSGVRAVIAVSGHPPPALVTQDGTVRFVGPGGTLLGVTPDVEIGVEEVELAVGDHLVLYTDGVTERRDGSRWFGDATLKQELRDTSGWPADLVAGRLEQRVRGFAVTAASDDLAVLVVGAVKAHREADPIPAQTGRREPSST
ncbi:MAG: putative magnesium/manganese-dependent protein phosphatase [Frankiales bacterium]|nr:putative magnesium/manganese-dependent protein phosphatase [Frankiales bacterium]